MAATRQNLAIEKGATLRFTTKWMQSNGVDPVDLTGYTAQMHIRLAHDAADPPLVELTSGNGGLILGASAGTIQIYMDDTATAALTFEDGVYDLELTDVAGTGDITRLIYGGVNVSPEVTR